MLKILSWHWEAGQSLTEGLADALQEAMAHFVRYLGAERLVAAEGVDPAIAALLESVNKNAVLD
jgi:hypothetical protein